MMTVNKPMWGILILLCATWAFAQKANLSGTWKAKTTSAQGSAEQTITFEQAGNTFTGQMITSQGTKEIIKNGKINGDEIEFTVERKRPTGETAEVPYKGKVKGNEISGTFTGANRTQCRVGRQKRSEIVRLGARASCPLLLCGWDARAPTSPMEEPWLSTARDF